MAQKKLKKMGLLQYEISAFAKEGCRSLHNSGYWEGRPFWGLGPSAFSFWNGARFQNICSLTRWHEAVRAGRSPIDFHEKLQDDASVRERFVIAIRMLQGAACPAILRKEVEKLVEEGLLRLEGDRACLTQKGILFYDAIAARLI
jgi:oxygen-independent coproporphyrinogen-3 oxidase